MAVKTLTQIIDELTPEEQGHGRYLSEPVNVTVSLRMPLEYRILLDVVAKKANKTRSAFAGELLTAALLEIRSSESFGADSEEAFKKGCLDAGVYLDEFLTQQEQLELWETDHKQEGGEDVQA